MKKSVILSLAILILALNLWIVGPLLLTHAGLGAANAAYILTRVATLIGVGYLLARTPGILRPQALALTAFVGFVDQVLLKGAFLLAGGETLPADAGAGAVFFGLAMSYMVFCPMIVILGFTGTELAARARTQSAR